MPETVEQTRPVKFLGLYRSDEYGVVGVREAMLLGSILRTAWRKDHDGKGVPEGTLANYVRKNSTDETWKIAIQRCLNWQWAELVVGFSGGHIRVKLTSRGEKHAIDLCCELQRRGKPVDGIDLAVQPSVGE
ncbi:MAG: hypothetical protein WB562_01315 [Candidatus Sulfotelmatobacter sp.]